ncbi:AsmA family protein [Parasalinivibrio latis]|uniref:AsmA family protein n=1 Tax=Parasalinivibrio latis TaxID=2952610 RepID=UPI0030DEE4A2
MRYLVRFLAIYLVILLLLVGSGIALLHTPYGLPVVKKGFQLVYGITFNASELHYRINDPWHVSLRDVSASKDLPAEANNLSPTFSAQRLDVWWNPESLLKFRLIFDAVIADGTTLSTEQTLPVSSNILIRSLALNRADISGEAVSVHQGQVQIDNWRYKGKSLGDFEGKFRLTAKTLNIHGEDITNVLADGRHDKGDWRFDTLSFDWEQASVSATADIGKSKVTVEQLTLSDARWQNRQALNELSAWLSKQLTQYNVSLIRVDLLNTSLEMDGLSVNALNLSADNLVVNQGKFDIWHQQDARLSFMADNILINNWLLTNPITEVFAYPGQLDVDASTGLLDGFVKVKGSLTENDIALDSLVINGVSWVAEEPEIASLTGYWKQLKQINISQMEINNLSLLWPQIGFPVQIAGLSADGKDLAAEPAKRFGLWHGDLNASASYISLNKVLVTEPYLETSAANGKWRLNQLSLPFKDGLMTVSGRIDYSNPAHPWALFGEGLSVPAATLRQWLKKDFPLSGELDMTFNANGLAAQQSSFNYSVTGQLDIEPQAVTIQLPAGESTKGWLESNPWLHPIAADFNAGDLGSQHIPLNIPAFSLQIDRGRITLPKVTIDANSQPIQVSGKWDLVGETGSLSVN